MRYLTLSVLLLAAPATAQELPPQQPVLPPVNLPAEDGAEFVIFPIRNGTFMISGPSSNALAQVGLEGVLLVDSGSGADAAGLMAAVRRISDRPIRYIFNTSADAAHTGGNAAISEGGPTELGGNDRPASVSGYGSVPILAHENVMTGMLADNAETGLPTLTYFVAQKDIHFNGEPVSLIHAPGHTDGDSFVMFRRSDVIAAGDIYTPDRYPDVSVERGGSITAYLASINRLIGLTVPEFNQQGGTMVVPGHGRLSVEGDIGEYRDMVTFIYDRVKAMLEQGMTLEQITEARPTFDYDTLFGAEAGDVFVAQIVASLAQGSAE